MRLVTLVGMSEFPKRRADWIHRGQCRLSIILAGNFLVLGGPEHGLEGESISSWESRMGGGREIVLQSTGNQLPKHTASLPEDLKWGQDKNMKTLASCPDLPSL